MGKKAVLLASTMMVVLGTPFANTMSGGKLFMSRTPQNRDLSQSEFEAIDWVQIKGVNNHGETGNDQNIVGIDTWDTVFQMKGKGIADAGSPDVVIVPIAGDEGQALFTAAGGATNHNSYAFKIERNDAPIGGQPTKIYNRGVVTGPRTGHGGNEDFDLETFTLGMEQQQIRVNASPIGLTGSAPAGVVGATYTFVPVVTGGTGSSTFEWFGTDLAAFDMEFNLTTGEISSTDIARAGTVQGAITVKDSTGATGWLPILFNVA